MTSTTLYEIRQQLRDVGGATLQGPAGKQLYLVLNRNLGMEQQGILIAYEGGGACFFDLDRPLNAFRLVERGFSLVVAPAISQLVNELLSSETSTYEPLKLITPEGR